MGQLVLQPLVDLLVVALLLLHLLELCLNMLGEVVDRGPVLLDSIVFLLVSRLMIVQLLVDVVDVLASLLVSLQGLSLFRLDQVVDGGAGLRNMVHDVVGCVLDTGFSLVEIFVLFGQVLLLNIVQPLEFVVVFLKECLVGLDNILMVGFE